jgi:zinc transport system permease protein
LTATLNPDLAYANGIDPKREHWVLTVALALVMAVAIKVMGVLLMAAMLLIPAAAARPFASMPKRMALIAKLIGALSALGGLQLVYRVDTLGEPTIVCLAAVMSGLSSMPEVVLKRCRN